MDEIFFNRESKDGTWEIVYDSSDDNVILLYFTGRQKTKKEEQLEFTKKEFLELKAFLSGLKLKKNYKIKTK